MSDAFIIRPETISEGIPITIEIRAPFLKDRDVLTIVNQDDKKEAIRVPIKENGNQSVAEFSLYKAGAYAVLLNDEVEILQVHPQRDLTFLSEFGMLASSVILVLGGLIIWNLKKRRKSAAGSF